MRLFCPVRETINIVNATLGIQHPRREDELLIAVVFR